MNKPEQERLFKSMNEKTVTFQTVGACCGFIRKHRMPVAFRCAHCRRLIVTDPEKGDKRFRFCSNKCEKGYWRHNSGRKSSIGSRWGAVFRLGEDGILRENCRDRWIGGGGEDV